MLYVNFKKQKIYKRTHDSKLKHNANKIIKQITLN